jgi:hypothetical protein
MAVMKVNQWPDWFNISGCGTAALVMQCNKTGADRLAIAAGRPARKIGS